MTAVNFCNAKAAVSRTIAARRYMSWRCEYIVRLNATFNSANICNSQEWRGNFWVPCTLASLGLVYQLGHGGFPCPFPDTTVRKMTVIEAPILHEIHVSYCKCSKSDNADNLEQLLRNTWYPATVTDPGTCATFRSLEAYRLYNVVGNMNVRDFITSLERITDASAVSGMTWLPVRTIDLDVVRWG